MRLSPDILHFRLQQDEFAVDRGFSMQVVYNATILQQNRSTFIFLKNVYV